MNPNNLFHCRIKSIIQFCIIISAGRAATTASNNKPFGIQSNEGNHNDGNSYAGSMMYEKSHNVIILTGTTYGTSFSSSAEAATNSHQSDVSNCFMSILQLPGGNDGPDEPIWIYKELIGENNNDGTSTAKNPVDTVCSSIIDISTDDDITNDRKRILIGGSTEEDGILTSLRKAGSNHAVQYGIALDLSLEIEDEKLEENVITTSNLLGGRLFHSSAIQSIRSMVASPANSDVVYVVSEESVSSLQSSSPISSVVQPNLLDNSKYYGAHKNQDMFLRLEQLPRKSADKIITDDTSGYIDTLDRRIWTKEIDMGSEMRVAGLDLIPSTNTLVLTYSVLEWSNARDDDIFFDNDHDNSENDWDGFIMLLDAANGITKSTLRIESQLGQDDIIHGYCRSPSLESDNGAVAFIIGTTTGHFESDKNTTKLGQRTAFLARITISTINGDESLNDDVDTSSVKVDWYIQIRARDETPGDMEGTKCVVTNDGKQVYVGGTIYDGAILDIDDEFSSTGVNENASSGVVNKGNDIWMGQVDSSRHLDSNRNWNWLVQLGSDDGDEYLSSLDVDQNNNLLVFGHTNGSFLHEKEDPGKDNMDVFVLSLLHDNGKFVDKLIHTDDKNNNNPATMISNIPATTTVPSTTSPTVTNNNISDAAPKPGVGNTIVPSPHSRTFNITLLFGLFVGIFILGGYIFLYFAHRISTKQKRIDEFIKQIEREDNDDDVNVKHSTSGTFHVVYVNGQGGLRYVVRGENDDENHESFVISDDDDSDDDVDSLHDNKYTTNSVAAAAIVNETLFPLDDYSTSMNTKGSLQCYNQNNNGIHSNSELLGNKDNYTATTTSSYNGLVDAYDYTWEDLSQHKLPNNSNGKNRDRSKRRRHRNHSLDEVDLNHTVNDDETDDIEAPWGRELM